MNHESPLAGAENFNQFNEKLISVEVAVLQELCHADEQEIASWIEQKNHGELLRSVVEEYLQSHNEIDVAELARLVQERDEAVEPLH